MVFSITDATLKPKLPILNPSKTLEEIGTADFSSEKLQLRPS